MIRVKLNVGDLDKQIQALVEAGKKKTMDEAVKNLSEATPVDTGEASLGWHHDGNKIINNVPHIEALNHGSSKQAPSNFVERTLLNIPGVNPNGTIVKLK